MKTILVTGATGFLGRHLVSFLRDCGFHVTALCRNCPEKKFRLNGVEYVFGDIEHPESLVIPFQGIHTVVHAAALISFNASDNKKMYQVNVLGTRNVVNACLSSGVKKIIYISSVAALNAELNQDVLVNETKAHKRSSDYGFTKYQGELEIFRGEAEGIDVCILNPSVIIGNSIDRRSSGFINYYVQTGLRIAPKGMINFVDVRDALEIVSRLVLTDGSPRRYILSSGYLSWVNFLKGLASASNRKRSYFIIPDFITYPIILVYQFICRIFNKKPLVTLALLRSANSSNRYNGGQVLKDFSLEYHSSENTFKWVSEGT